MAEYTPLQNRIMKLHQLEARGNSAEVYNLGATIGNDFIISRTSRGKLKSFIRDDGSIEHIWMK
jgi:hypothetical protein